MTTKQKQRRTLRNKARRAAKAALTSYPEVKPQQGRTVIDSDDRTAHNNAKIWRSRNPDGLTINISKLKLEHRLIPENKATKIRYEPAKTEATRRYKLRGKK